MKFSLSRARALPISGIQRSLALKMMPRRWRGGEKAATHLTNHPNSFNTQILDQNFSQIGHKADDGHRAAAKV